MRTEIALIAEELSLKDERWRRVHPHRRPHYGPVQRMRILELRAARGWSAQQTAERFHVTEETITSWMRRLDEAGEAGLVHTEEPLNKFPDFVAYLVRSLKRTCPSLGKKKIAQVLASRRHAPRRQHGREDAEKGSPEAGCGGRAPRGGSAAGESEVAQ
jgi:transcriptional regulator with XRE-family HTH domain